jgi:hypothetical protein
MDFSTYSINGFTDIVEIDMKNSTKALGTSDFLLHWSVIKPSLHTTKNELFCVPQTTSERLLGNSDFQPY